MINLKLWRKRIKAAAKRPRSWIGPLMGLPMHPDTVAACADNYDWDTTDVKAPVANRFYNWDWK